MKKLFVLPMVAAALALSGCGKNLGKEVDKATFDAKVAEIAKKTPVAPKRIAAKGKVNANDKKQDVNLDLTYEDFMKDPLGKSVAEIVGRYTISRVESMSEGSSYKRSFHIDDKAETVGIAFSGSEKESEMGMTYEASVDAKFAWNMYGYATYILMDTKESISAAGESETVKALIELDIAYTF